MPADNPYTDADVEVAINAYHWAARNSCGPDNCPGAAVCVYAEHLTPEPFCAALDALAAAGRLAHDCERRPCPFEDLWNDSDPKPDDALARLQAAFNDAVAELSERYAERDKLRADLAKQIEETMEVATELAEACTTAAEMTRAVKRLRDELTDAQAEAKGARSDYEELKGINAKLADERDALRQENARLRRRNDSLEEEVASFNRLYLTERQR